MPAATTASLPSILRLCEPRAMVLPGEQDLARDETDEEDDRDRRQDQRQPHVLLPLLFVRHGRSSVRRGALVRVHRLRQRVQHAGGRRVQARGRLGGGGGGGWGWGRGGAAPPPPPVAGAAPPLAGGVVPGDAAGRPHPGRAWR